MWADKKISRTEKKKLRLKYSFLSCDKTASKNIPRQIILPQKMRAWRSATNMQKTFLSQLAGATYTAWICSTFAGHRLYTNNSEEPYLTRSTCLSAALIFSPMPAAPSVPSCLLSKPCHGPLLLNYSVLMQTLVFYVAVPLANLHTSMKNKSHVLLLPVSFRAKTSIVPRL